MVFDGIHDLKRLVSGLPRKRTIMRQGQASPEKAQGRELYGINYEF